MSLVIEVKDASVEESTVNGSNGSFQTRRQFGWVQMPNGETRKVRIRLDRQAKPHAVGRYTVGPASFVVGQYGDLQLGTLELLPLVAGAR